MSDQTPKIVRAFLDANAIYAASIDANGGASKLWAIPNVVLVTNEYAAKEAWENLSGARNANDIKACLDRMTVLMQSVELHPGDGDTTGGLFCPWKLTDPNDVPILMGAINGKCDYLITLDSKCFGEYFGMSLDGVMVLKPGKFLDLHGL